jgi:hypothetical protein
MTQDWHATDDPGARHWRVWIGPGGKLYAWLNDAKPPVMLVASDAGWLERRMRAEGGDNHSG